VGRPTSASAYNWKVGPVVITPQIFIFRVFDNQQVTSYDTYFNPFGSFVTNTASPYYGQPGVEPGPGNCPAGGAPCSDNPDYHEGLGAVESAADPGRHQDSRSE